MDPKWARCKWDSKNHARHLPIFNIKNLYVNKIARNTLKVKHYNIW